ncbi:cadherin-17 [Megalobrama amblycephala]|uniref:cadherin-17 n=1 Tax=Megalobrama amblycephala TaxID=75352 RepID=UPI0020143361|nr:cadherin-17 [Megalobrama amblycephala]XP_048009768.1 cadherin-17 [Megalobrama amblycephala]
MRGAHLLHLTLLVSIAHGIGLEDKKGPLENKVLDVPEATPVPYPIYQFTSASEDVSSYHVSGETEEKISISSDGWLFLENPLEWSPEKKHHLEIEAHSADGEIVDGPYSVVLQVVDVNNNAPVFSESQYSGSVREHSPAGFVFMQVSASDADDPDTVNAQLKFSIVNQIPSPRDTFYFDINPDNGEIFITDEGAEFLRARPTVTYSRDEVRGSPDVLRKKFEDYCIPKNNIPLENNPFYTCVERVERRQVNLHLDPDFVLSVRVEDLGDPNALSNTARISIDIIQNLWFSPGPITIKENLDEEYPMYLTTVRSNDPTALYRLVQKERLSFPFTINEDGEIHVTAPLDREEKNMYILVAMAEDEQGIELEKPLEIFVRVEDVNDNPPVCDEAVFEVQENEPIGNLIGVLPAHDSDEENTLNSLLTYTLLSQTPIKPSEKMFTIDQVNGEIKVANQNFQRKVVSEYELTFRVADQVYSTECKAIIKVIDINNEIPVFEKKDYGTYSVPELAEVGTTLLTIKATDADDPGTGSSRVEYHISSGDPHNLFTIEVDESTGEGRVYIARPLDYELQSVYNLQIDARNPEPLIKGVEYNENATAVVVIQLVDVDEPPEFEVDTLNVNVPENITVGTVLMKAEAKDPEGKTIKLKMEGDEHNWLELDADTGELKTKAALDRETVEQITLTVIAYETEGDKQESEMKVNIHLLDVNDNYPKLKWTRNYICIQEMNPLTLTAVDNDADPYGEPFTFSFNRKSSNFELKTVDGTSANLILKKKPSSDQDVTVPINIKDNAGMGITQKFDVRICNCTKLGYCYMEPEAHSWKLGMSSTIGILAGIFGFIILFLVIVVYRIKKKNQRRAAAGEETENKAML